MSTPPDEKDPGATEPAGNAQRAAEPAPRSNRSAAVLSVVLGVVSIPMFLCFGAGAVFGTLAVIAATRGVRATQDRATQDRATPDRATRNVAITGMVLGIIGIVLGLGFLALLIFSPEQTTVRTR